jgi:hypothetical protein
VSKESQTSDDSSSRHYARASNRVAEVEAMLARQKGKVAGLRRLGLPDEANAARCTVVKIKCLLQLCIDERDRTSHKTVH